MKLLSLTLLIFFFSFSLFSVAADTTIEIYRDGYVSVERVIEINELQAAIEIDLLTENIEFIYVTGEDGSPIYYEQEGSKLIIYNIGEESITLTYFTADATEKSGTLWSFKAHSDDGLSVRLPEDSTILYVEPIPEEIDLQNSEIKFSADSEIILEYVFGLEDGSDDANRPLAIVAPIAAIVVLIILFLRLRKRPKSPWKNDKRLDLLEKKVLDFISEEGEKMESEVRERFNMPKTSSWRMLRRLEEYGYIRTNKKNKVNFIELNRKS